MSTISIVQTRAQTAQAATANGGDEPLPNPPAQTGSASPRGLWGGDSLYGQLDTRPPGAWLSGGGDVAKVQAVPPTQRRDGEQDPRTQLPDPQTEPRIAPRETSSKLRTKRSIAACMNPPNSSNQRSAISRGNRNGRFHNVWDPRG